MSTEAKTCKEFRRWLELMFFVCHDFCLCHDVYVMFTCSYAKEACGDWSADPDQHMEWSGFLQVHASRDHQRTAEGQSCLIQAQHEHHLWGPKNRPKQCWSMDAVAQPGLWSRACSLLFSQGSPLSLSRSSSREGIGNGSDSDNWRDRNGLSSHAEFPSTVSSPKRKQNKSGQSQYIIH